MNSTVRAFVNSREVKILLVIYILVSWKSDFSHAMLTIPGKVTCLYYYFATIWIGNRMTKHIAIDIGATCNGVDIT